MPDLANPTPSLLPSILTDASANAKDEVFDVKDNLTGIIPQIPVLEIIHKEQMFRLKNDAGAPFPGFKGIIVYHHMGRVWFENPMEVGRKQRPNCVSKTGHFGEPTQINPDGKDSCPIPNALRAANKSKYGHALLCDTCPMNAWGSDAKGSRGKACKEKHRIFILPTEQSLASLIPYLLIVPPTSLKAINAFFSTLVSRNIPHQTVITEFKLKRVDNNDGTDYSELVLTADLSRKLPRSDQVVLKGFIDMHKQAFAEVDDEGQDSRAASQEGEGGSPQSSGKNEIDF